MQFPILGRYPPGVTFPFCTGTCKCLRGPAQNKGFRVRQPSERPRSMQRRDRDWTGHGRGRVCGQGLPSATAVHTLGRGGRRPPQASSYGLG